MSKETKQTRIDLLVESIAVEKQVLAELCDDLATCRDTLNKKGAKVVTKDIELQTKRYNGLISEYNKLTGEKVELVSKDLPAQIMGGSNNYNLKTVGNPTVISANSYNPNVSVLNQKELKSYLEKSDRALYSVQSRLETAVQQKNQANGYNKVLLIINCLTYQRYIVERIAENLHVCCQILDNKKVKELKKTLETEIANYNKFVDEYETLTRTNLTHASTTIADDIIAGKPYTPIPSISYTANDGTTRNSDAEVAAVAVAAAAAAEKAKNKKKTNKKNKDVVQKTKLQEKVAEQANKDLSVVAKAADFEITLLESQKDMTNFKYGKTTIDMKQQKKDVDAKIKVIQKNTKEALKLEEADNARYYEVITNDPATMEIKGNDKKRAKIAELRTKMMALLNKRDELNSKLLAIYNGSEVNLDGTSVNHTWRQIKSDAAEKCINKNKSLAKKVEKLPASAGEKQRIHNLMNSNVDAASTLALTKYRLKTKEYKNKDEKKQLNKDVTNMNKLIKANNGDISWIIKKIKKRA